MSEDPGELHRFYDETIAPLVAYDEQYETDLVTTLETFLDCDGNVANTAGRLFTHRHTIRYRLVRVHELTGHDVALDRRPRAARPRPQGDARARHRGARRPGARARRRRRPRPARAQGPVGPATMRVGIITGSGTYALPELRGGSPRTSRPRLGRRASRRGTFAGVDVVHVSRHGEGHAASPTTSPTGPTSPRCGTQGATPCSRSPSAAPSTRASRSAR